MSANDEQEQLKEFVALLAMLSADERYQVAVELLDVAEKYSNGAANG